MAKLTRSISFKNLTGRPTSTVILIILAMILSMSVFIGTLVVSSLRTGLNSLEDRLGADVMVVPYEATTKENLEGDIMQGNMGYFYMNNSIVDKLSEVEGVGQMSSQFFLVSTSSGCCSLPVQIIGYDPKTDFTITPWIKKSHGGDLQDMEVVVGNDLNAFVGDTLKFYGKEVKVAAKLDKTGTGLDTAVYTNDSTIKTLIQASLDKNLNTFKNVDPQKVVSCVLINAADGYTPEEVKNNINIYVRKIKAFQTKNMITGVSTSLSGVSDVIAILIAVVWVFAVGIMIAAFILSVNERKKEFAVLRAIGASRKKLGRIVMGEGVMVSLFGSAVGVALGALIIIPFSTLIENMLGLPFLLPGIIPIVITGLCAVLVATIAGLASCMVASRRISKIDTGVILRSN